MSYQTILENIQTNYYSTSSKSFVDDCLTYGKEFLKLNNVKVPIGTLYRVIRPVKHSYVDALNAMEEYITAILKSAYDSNLDH